MMQNISLLLTPNHCCAALSRYLYHFDYMHLLYSLSFNYFNPKNTFFMENIFAFLVSTFPQQLETWKARV
ncbi:hypothetical protein FKM82_010258 [Ascaphus truei]